MKSQPTFSQRIGVSPLEPAFQLNSVSTELRNRLWSLVHQHCLSNVTFEKYYIGSTRKSSRYSLFITIWDSYFKAPTDTIPELYAHGEGQIREWYFRSNWHHIYDLVELVGRSLSQRERIMFWTRGNQILQEENAGYRFIDGILSPITDQNELTSISTAISSSDAWQPVALHLRAALTLLSDKESPDFRNSIKESISAVESAARLLTGDPKPTLGDAVKVLERTGKLHPALAKALSSLYGYTNDADGIRHSLLEEPNLTYLEAKFMLVACSAFCNHLRGKAT